MNFDTMNKAIMLIDADLIEAADAQPEKANFTVFKPWMKYAVAAVLIAVFAIGTPVALNMMGVFGTNHVAESGSNGGSDSDVSEIIYPHEDDNHSTVSEPPQPILPASNGSYEEQDAHGGDDRVRLTNYKYSDIRLTSIDTIWDKYITEQTGEDVLDLWKADWRTAQGSAFSLIEIVDELKVSKEKFVELNNKKLGEIRSTNYFTEEVIFRDYCFTDEEIEIIYSGDKNRIAEAFANPYAVIADDWEIYPLRWIINNPATLYKERQISVEALETAVNKLVSMGEDQISDEDSAALLARVEEYKKMQ